MFKEHSNHDGFRSSHGALFTTILLICLLAINGCASVAPDISESLQQRALDGEVQAQFEIGLKYREAGQNFWRVNVEYLEDAAGWFEMAANQDDPRAQYYLSLYYFNMRQDYGRAFELVKRSAEQGVAEAQYSVGMHYAQAWGTQQNLPLAYKWIALANDGGVKGGSLVDVDWLIWRANMNSVQIAEGRRLADEHLAQYGKSQLIKSMY